MFFVICFLWVQGAVSQELTGTIDSVEVVGVRPLSDIGMQRTVIGEEQLRANISLSLAEILGHSSPLFIKSAGRATLATASLRGTQPSDLQVFWNGLPINSAMLGMTDFSSIPSFLVDRAQIYNGASSMGITGGGLGGAVELTTFHDGANGLKLNYIQGIGSWNSFDEFINLSYGGHRWSGSTRASLSTSKNDFTYINYDRKEFVLDANGLIVNSFYPRERNRNGEFIDANILQKFQYRSPKLGNFSLSSWWLHSKRGIPMLSVSYYDDAARTAVQSEQTLRTVANWALTLNKLHLSASGGYAYSDQLYLATLTGNGITTESSHAQSYTHTLYGQASASAAFSEHFYGELTGRLTQYFVHTADLARLPSSPAEPMGYIQNRAEISISSILRWRPVDRFGIGGTLRGEIVGKQTAPILAAAFVDFLLSPAWNLIAKASVATNYRFPSLNDLYYRPGGNRNLRPEHGLTADAGFDFRRDDGDLTYSGHATLYFSHITDWIVWRPTAGGFFTPVNIALVESHGAEFSGALGWQISECWRLNTSARAAITHSQNMSPALTVADRSRGVQLPYIPIVTASLDVELSYCGWLAGYIFDHYSRRFTTTDNSFSISGSLPPYYISEIYLGRKLLLSAGEFSLRFTIHNLLGERYVSILSHPMPGRTFELMLSFTPYF